MKNLFKVVALALVLTLGATSGVYAADVEVSVPYSEDCLGYGEGDGIRNLDGTGARRGQRGGNPENPENMLGQGQRLQDGTGNQNGNSRGMENGIRKLDGSGLGSGHINGNCEFSSTVSEM